MTPRWQALTPGAYGIDAKSPGADPMWVWADATGYREHRAIDRGMGRGVIIDWGSGVECAQFAGGEIAPAQYVELSRSGAKLELSEPVIPLRPLPRDRAPVECEGDAPTSSAELLVAVIDSGCPFAARMLRDTSGLGTRVLAIWDQDQRPSFASCGGYRPRGLGYGCAIGREQLNDVMTRATRHDDGSVEEDLCYRLAGYDAVGRWASHGAAVLSQLLGEPVYGGALQPSPGVPPSWDAYRPLPIDSADVVFVQMARDAVQDSTSAGLARTIIDGLRFILERADPKLTRRIVVNISSGTSRSAHDGTSMLERAIVSWIDDAAKLGIEASVVIPIGNTNDEQRHAVLSDSGYALQLLVPPDTEMPQYVTVRWPTALAKDVVLRVMPPSGVQCVVACGEAQGWPDAAQPACGVIWPQPETGQTSCALIVVAPTAAGSAALPVARSGRWRIEIGSVTRANIALKDPVRFWISRNQINPGAIARSRQAYFIDADELHEPTRHLRLQPSRNDSNVRNGIRRHGALSGLATIARDDGRVVVVGGYVLRDNDDKPSDYSASGPAAGVASERRVGPDVSLPCDSSHALRGLTVRANRSGAVVRMVGTSFAAPLAARALANGALGQQRAQPPLRDPGRKGRCLRPESL
jgi:Subtilase family